MVIDPGQTYAYREIPPTFGLIWPEMDRIDLYWPNLDCVVSPYSVGNVVLGRSDLAAPSLLTEQKN
jgi:hypothetical protein